MSVSYSTFGRTVEVSKNTGRMEDIRYHEHVDLDRDREIQWLLVSLPLLPKFRESDGHFRPVLGSRSVDIIMSQEK